MFIEFEIAQFDNQILKLNPKNGNKSLILLIIQTKY